ncbi:MAG TPA: hypothetical protein DEH22_06220 [Chloroflexi bacterium]|nr:hypothetical protein [Chloroflexota bacterium]
MRGFGFFDPWIFKKNFFRSIILCELFLLGLSISACQSAAAGMPPAVTSTPTATSLQPSSTPLPTGTEAAALPSATPGFMATASPTVPATATHTATPTPRGALTWDQEQRLYETSLTFLADNPEDATLVVRDQIDYLQSEAEDPSLACGPIAAAILRDAGLLPPDTDVHGFWLLDPRLRTSQIVLETYFPKERYAWYQIPTSTIQFDFNAFPLLAGDFLYLYAGNYGGTFEHMIVVTRVDETGRAYTVTNLHTEEGFVIRELMLYDPAQPGVGQFYDWLNRELNSWLGMTGDGGFDLWRPLAPVQDYAVPTGH